MTDNRKSGAAGQPDVLFFDLDHTLWDFERNSGEALAETLHNLGLIGRNGLTEEAFISRYHVINDRMWDEYRRGVIEKSQLRTRRFADALALFSIRDNGLAERFAQMYLDICPRKKNLFPGAQQVLEELSARYPVWLLTNGFSEVQAIKINNPAINLYISGMVTSEEAGAKKPSRAIFDYAVRKAGVEAARCAMIGDDMDNDVLAALDAGFLRAVWFNPTGKKHAVSGRGDVSEIQSLTELTDIF